VVSVFPEKKKLELETYKNIFFILVSFLAVNDLDFKIHVLSVEKNKKGG